MKKKIDTVKLYDIWFDSLCNGNYEMFEKRIKDLLAKESNEEYSQRIMMEQVPKQEERSGWFTCNRCGIKFHVDHDITENGALCNSCFSNLVDKTHPTPSPLDEIEEIEEVKFGMDSNQTFENFYDAINSLIHNQKKLYQFIKEKL